MYRRSRHHAVEKGNSHSGRVDTTHSQALFTRCCFTRCSFPLVPCVAPQFIDVSPEKLSDEIAAVFARVDEDGNCNLDRGEFRFAMTMILGRTMKEEEVDVLVCDIDADGNGLISPQEFEHLVRWSLKVPCLSSCEICASKLGKHLHGNLWEPEPRSEFQPAPPPISRPQTAQRMRCENFERCGFEGPLRVVAAHELDCCLVRHAGHSIAGPLLKSLKPPQSHIILPPIAAASLSPVRPKPSMLGDAIIERTASDSIVNSGITVRHAGFGFSRTASNSSNSSNKSNESLSQGERVRKLGLLISINYRKYLNPEPQYINALIH